MRKFFLSIFTALLAIGFVGCEYDDSALWGEVNSLKDRVLTLEQLCQQMNTNISSLQSLVSALQNQDYITSVTPIKQGNDVIGYTITFAKGEPITIYHGQNGKDGQNGADGKDGYTPVIGVDKADDGKYYWTLDGEWLTDKEGNKIPATGKDGKDGADGKDGQDGKDGEDGKDGADGKDGQDGKDGEDGDDAAAVMPELKIQGGYWYISYDGGENWERLGRATGYDGTDGKDGAHGDSWFKSVVDKGDCVEFTLKDGTVIVMPKYGNELELKAAIGGTVVLEENMVLDEPLVVAEGVELVIDLNGKKILGDFAKGDGAVITNNGKLTLEGDGTIENTAVNGDATIANNGELTLEGVTVAGAPIGSTSYPEYAITTSGTLVVEDGTTIYSDRGAIRISNGADVTINGGDIYVTDALGTRVLTSHVIWAGGSSSKLTINNGNLASKYAPSADNGSSVISPAGATIEVKNGNFSFAGPKGGQGGIFQNYMGYGDHTDVYGGTYNDDTVTKSNNLASGYIAAKSGDLWYVIEASAGASATDQSSLNNALTNATGDTTIILDDGNYSMPSASNSDVTIVGNEDVVITVDKPNLSGSDVTLEGVTVKGSGYATGIQHVNTVTYNDVNVVGEMCLYGEKVVFNNCTFNLATGQYIWTYGAKVVEFNDCTFNTAGKAILIYNEGAGANDVTVKGCTFNATAGATASAIANQNCAAIEIDNFQSSGTGAAHKLTTEYNTYNSNFSGEWRIKNYVAGNVITVNGKTYDYIAIDGKKMTIDASKNVTVVE